MRNPLETILWPLGKPDLRSVKRVEGSNAGPLADKPESAPEKPDVDVEKYKEQAQGLVDSHKRFFQTFAKDVSLSFKPSDAFYIDLERGEVNLAAQWFAEKGYSPDQFVWACLHELTHFRDL
ncbi:hypothetical protein HY224_03205, partial [Candidatus Uhrbacteria bacterium]|nr:hypothetical protein [Candidatus Uhrbacteria bacterium]